MIEIAPHPLLDARVFVTRFAQPLGDTPAPPWLLELLTAGARTPLAALAADDPLRGVIRDLLRHGGFKPTGRSKPASEYLVRAASEAGLASINPAVDAGNAVSLHSGVPISVADLDRLRPPLRIEVAAPDARFVFNSAGQEIDVGRLLGLSDADGPCANAVKDAMRTKTTPATTSTLTVMWGARAIAGRTDAALTWYHELLARLGAGVEPA
jgi:DNA/RNA-binding domain of Phe-tRNA-synthetase-like protein